MVRDDLSLPWLDSRCKLKTFMLWIIWIEVLGRQRITHHSSFFVFHPFFFFSYALPLAIAFVAFILRWIADSTCSPYSSVCKKSSDFLSHLYAVVICFLLIIGATKAKQIRDLVKRLKTAFEVMNTDPVKSKKD